MVVVSELIYLTDQVKEPPLVQKKATIQDNFPPDSTFREPHQKSSPPNWILKLFFFWNIGF